MNFEIEHEDRRCDCHGFDIIARMQDAKLSFDAAGTEGLISFIQANITSGNVDPDAIVEEAIRVTGAHIEDRIRSLIVDSENIHWTVASNGLLALPLYDNA